jgi:hypothetical protein
LSILRKWESWSLPTKLTLMFTFLSLFVAVLQLFEAPQRLSALFWPNPPAPYDLALNKAILDLHRSNICLTSRLIAVGYDENSPSSESNDQIPRCKLELQGLQEFAQGYTNYLAATPYSGAESLRGFTETLILSQDLINDAENVAQLIVAQNKIEMSLAEVGFWICGLEWYLRSAPEGPGHANASKKNQIQLTEVWNQWDEHNGKSQTASVERRKNYQQGDATNQCTGFIDLLD